MANIQTSTSICSVHISTFCLDVWGCSEQYYLVSWSSHDSLWFLAICCFWLVSVCDFVWHVWTFLHCEFFAICRLTWDRLLMAGFPLCLGKEGSWVLILPLIVHHPTLSLLLLFLFHICLLIFVSFLFYIWLLFHFIFVWFFISYLVFGPNPPTDCAPSHPVSFCLLFCFIFVCFSFHIGLLSHWN